jgi:O-antigen ligase
MKGQGGPVCAAPKRIAGWSSFFLCAFSPVFLLVPYLSLHVAALVALVAVVVSVRGEGRSIGALTRTVSPGFPVFAFFGLTFASILWAEYPSHAFSWAITDGFYPAFLALALIAAREDRGWILATVAVLPTVCLASFGYLLLAYGSIRPESLTMLDSVGAVSDTFPALCLLCVPFLAMPFAGGPGGRVPATVGLVAALAVVILSGSRGALLLILPVVVLSALFLGSDLRQRASVAAKLSVAVAAVVAICLLLAPQLTVFTRSEALFGSNPFTGKLPEEKFRAEEPPPVPDYPRLLTYREGVRMVAENSVIGAGYMGLRPRMEEVYGRPTSSHNLIITAWGELGLPGLLALLWIIWAGLLGLWRGRSDPFVLAAGVAFLVAGAHAQVRPQLSNVMLYVVLAVLLTASRETARVSKERELKAENSTIWPYPRP